MRKINSHKVNPCNDIIEINVVDEKGAGGANHKYNVVIPNVGITPIYFQNGPIKETGVNGITQEILIAICIDRLQCFQAGAYACRENAIALTKLQEAQMWLQSRTRERMAREVEGTHTI